MTQAAARLEGLDVARFLALVGMVIVNFSMVMVGDVTDRSPFAPASLLQGRAAATFVVLAGISLGLAARRNSWDECRNVTLKRALFLLVVGLLNSLIFDADIIHYYAVYFLLALLFLRAPNWVLLVAITGLVVGFLGMALLLDYDAGWNWEDYSYAGFWTPGGFLRNLIFNGWHPIIPWFAFVLFGIWLSRQDLRARTTQIQLLTAGWVVFGLVVALASYFTAIVAPIDAEAAILFTTAPVPPMPLYMLAGASFACGIIGLCLLLEDRLRNLGILPILTRPGRQTLTLYIAHILLGMTTLGALGLLGGQSQQITLLAAAIFCVLATLFAVLWAGRFRRGPLEGLMRRLTETPNRKETN